MHLLQRSANLANLGAHHFSTGDDFNAYGAMRRALGVLQEAADSGCDFDVVMDEKIMQADDAQQLQQQTIRPYIAIPFDCPTNERAVFGAADEADKTVFYVNTRPFVFDQAAVNVANTSIYISITIFNMTLLLLRKARSDKDGLLAMKKAVRLFGMAEVILKTAPENVDNSNILAAVLNNKAHACFCLHQFDDAHQALEDLSNLISNACATDSLYINEEELTEMLLNTLLHSDPTRLASAA